MASKAWILIVGTVTGTSSQIWQRLANPTVGRGQRQWPTTPAESDSVGIRFDYDGEVVRDEKDARGGKKVAVTYHRWVIHPGAGNNIPPAWKEWRDRHGGAAAVVGVFMVPKNADRNQVAAALAAVKIVA